MNREAENTLPVQPPGKKLTIAANRLAGSTACLNCGTQLMGPFCYYCGQPDKNLMRFFPALLRELLADTFDFDSRFLRTLKPLLLKPGKLTRDYLDGRRFRYVPPLRLYVFSSIAFFFIAAMLATDVFQISTDSEDALDEPLKFSAEEQAKLDEKLRDVDPAVAAEVNRAIAEASGEKQSESGLVIDDNEINLNGQPWDRETNPLIIPLAPDLINDWINDEIGNSPAKGRQIEENPDLIKDKMFDVLPVTMFVLVPLVALLFKFWYLFAKKYYVEHLIFALHNHAFLFAVILIIMLTNTYAGWRDPDETGLVTSGVNILNVIIAVWIPVYLLVSLKRVYRQNWWMTMTKFSCIGISYLVLLILTSAFAALLSFLLV